jgi:hypothetical protein
MKKDFLGWVENEKKKRFFNHLKVLTLNWQKIAIIA